MTHITQDMALTLLDTLRTMAGTHVDYVTIGADTPHATMVGYSPYAEDGDGAWEMIPVADTTSITTIADIYEASQYLLGLDARLVH